MLQITPNKKTDLTLSIKTTVIDPDLLEASAEEVLDLLKRVIEGDDVDESEINDLVEGEETTEMELCTEATAEINRDGCIEIAYLENEDDEVLKTHSKIIFSPNDPSLVVMTKEGAMRAILSFEERKTHICTYDTPFMPIKVYVSASRVDNRLLTDGYLALKYVLILNDTPPQHFSVEVKIKETPEDTLKKMFL